MSHLLQGSARLAAATPARGGISMSIGRQTGDALPDSGLPDGNHYPTTPEPRAAWQASQ